MAAKLVIHRFEEGINFKSLRITINPKDADKQEAEFGDWLDGKIDDNRRDSTKPRLVVKLVSGDDCDIFSLELCAKKIADSEEYYNWNNTLNYQNRINSSISLDHIGNTDANDYFNDEKNSVTKSNDVSNFLNPLEYSIEKVKENNARIMENIHMLNRTLNYTKKKEILDIICPKPLQSYPCEACGKCFVYETGLKRHYASRHAIIEPHPRWQVVWTCTECFQVWPRHDLALNHTTQCCDKENSDCIREIKTSSLLQCEFCEQVFTNIPRLLKHSKTHMVASNYECSTCNISFVCYRSAELHWLSCPWVNICYKFSLPKMFLCNVCDRKFKNYEQLYNHR